jgi:adenine-specific DNA-methyltransferase
MAAGGARKKSAGPTRVEVLRHDDKRTNIPTDELRAFVDEDEREPQRLRYPRDKALDPQLVWRGKDEQDAEGLEVPAVPIYIQEKIHPRVLIENLRQTAAAGEPEPELALFNDFNGIEFEELVDFYAHEQNWTNRLILGDSLLVMASLAEKENLRGKVQTIFIDPPYGIGFASNWQVTTQSREVTDGKLDHLTRQPEQIRAFRDTWKDGIHTYLTYLRDRLTVARDLLADTGHVFVQIGDENVHLVRSLLDEAFGPENFISLVTFRKTAGATGDFLPGTVDYVLWYAKDRGRAKYRQLYREREVGGVGGGAYNRVALPDGTRRRMTAEERQDLSILPAGARPYRLQTLTSESQGRAKGEGAASWFPVEVDGKTYRPSMQARWKTNETGMERLRLADRLEGGGRTLNYVRFHDDFPAFPVTNFWEDTQSGSGMDKVYVVQTNTKVVERCMLMTSDPGDLVLDPTNGSGTTAVVAEEWGRRWITIDTSRVAVALTRTRLAALRLPYYLLADSPEGQTKEQEITKRPDASGPYRGDVRRGFVYKRVPHVMLRDIAQNADIKPGMSREDIEAAIARGSEQEFLFDQPYEDRRIVRVCGPFTVESLSPHRMLADEDLPETEEVPESSGDYEQTILGNLSKAGVQNRDRAQRLEFQTLEPYAGGRWIHARGTFTGEDGETRTVGISLGPEYGTVGSDQVREAAKEAVKGVGFDLLLVCGFAFDAHSGEAAKEFKPESADDGGGGWAVAAEERQFGRLPVMLVRMNQDLSMGEELLKKTGAGNLFMVFGEPDIVIERTEDGQVEVEVLGVDVYNPTTGEIRSDSTDDIACWFIDTNYNGESFFVRDAYFTGANDPYKRLRKALKADIDQDAWESLYRTRSRPFAPPETGTIAVKVINHHGDEVLKTYPVA